MSVIIRPITIISRGIGGSNVAFSFSDDFTRGDTLNNLGPGWMGPISQGGVNFISTAESPGWKITSNQAVAFQPTNGTPGDGSCWCWLPHAIVSTLYGIAQFVQVRYKSTVGDNTSRVGAGVMLSGEPSLNGYNMQKTGAATVAVRRATPAGTVLLGNFALAANDLLRLVVTQVSASSNFVEMFINGVSQGSLTDNNASRPIQTGCPGLTINSLNLAANTETFDDFSCGPA